jgi:CBS domain-containing protein
MNKKISDFLSDDKALTVDSNARVIDAINLMNSEKRNYVLVIENNIMQGIFTERDLLNRVLSEKKLPADVMIRDVMTPNPDALSRDDYIGYAIERMARYGYRNIPIEDSKQGPVVLTVWNVMTHISDILADAEEIETDREIMEDISDIGGG